MTSRPRIELRPSDVTVIVDNCEGLPWDLSPLRMERGKLRTGDYAVKGLEEYTAIERKSVDDLLSVIGKNRDVFEREVERLLAHECRAIIVEGHFSTIEMGQYRSEIHPNAAIGSITSWIARGVPVLFCGTRENAQRFAARLLFQAARRRWESLRGFLPTLKVIGDTNDGESEPGHDHGQLGRRPRAKKDGKRESGVGAPGRDEREA